MGLFFYCSPREAVLNRTFVSRVAGKIESFLGEFGGQKGIFPVEVIIRGQPGNLVIDVFIDGDTGIDAGTCADISRALGKELDAGVLEGEGYALTVSSPGLDRPLRFPRQYHKHAGRRIAVTLRSGETVERTEGILLAVGDRSISVGQESGDAPREVPFDRIVEATIVPRW